MKNLKTFFIWIRNGVAFCFTWLMVVILLRNTYLGIENISTTEIFKLLILACGGVILFTALFSETLIKGISFTAKLTGFMVLFSVYETVIFYWLGIFSGKGNVIQWMLFLGIILVMYGISMVGYELYSRKKAKDYDNALYAYQEKRGGKSW
ncbi:MAG: hypothetical protein IJC02_07085 [Lachnospiraceae bacterium]|nr:hypothetical protein [Lachnospiraceae bacterium]